jgi:hypothetical protein
MPPESRGKKASGVNFQALRMARYERADARRGCRNGPQTRRITTTVGAQAFAVPRGRVVDEDGLVAFGQIQPKKIDGHRHVPELLTPAVAKAA